MVCVLILCLLRARVYGTDNMGKRRSTRTKASRPTQKWQSPPFLCACCGMDEVYTEIRHKVKLGRLTGHKCGVVWTMDISNLDDHVVRAALCLVPFVSRL
jgi:hypothetical protein